MICTSAQSETFVRQLQANHWFDSECRIGPRCEPWGLIKARMMDSCALEQWLLERLLRQLESHCKLSTAQVLKESADHFTRCTKKALGDLNVFQSLSCSRQEGNWAVFDLIFDLLSLQRGRYLIIVVDLLKLYRIIRFTWERLHGCGDVFWAGAGWWEKVLLCLPFKFRQSCGWLNVLWQDVKLNIWCKIQRWRLEEGGELTLGSWKKLWWQRSSVVSACVRVHTSWRCCGAVWFARWLLKPTSADF